MSKQKQNYDHLVNSDGTYGIDVEDGIYPGGGGGSKGQKGAKGVDGSNGTKGTKGVDGANGTKGIKGQNGASGANGTKGGKGEKGTASGIFTFAGTVPDTASLPASADVGTVYKVTADNNFVAWNGSAWVVVGSGITPVKGEPGANGAKGQKGQKGINGTNGTDGQKGASGTAGSNGTKGQKGATGAVASKGEKGEKGQKGTTGTTGQKGTTGTTGGKGQKGTGGTDGTDGAKGVRGTKGAPGEKGTKGSSGAAASKGEKGQKGADSATNNTWTAQLRGSATEPSTLITSTGRYWAAGRMVFVTATFSTFSTTGYSGYVSVDNLPFAASTGLDSVGSCYHDEMMINSQNHGDDEVTPIINGGTSYIEFLTDQVPRTAPTVWIQNSSVATMTVSIWYFRDLP